MAVVSGCGGGRELNKKKNREKLLSQIGSMACTFPDIFSQIRMGIFEHADIDNA